MEAFIRQVPWQADHIQVQRGIASVLHSAPEYNVHNDSRPGQRLNFKVHLLPDRKGTRKHGGVGKITFPSVEVGSRFLQDFGGQSPLRTIFVGNRQLRFEPSRDRVRKDIIEELNRLPYADPAAKEKMEKKKELFESKRVLVRTIQFGWITREYSFSPEWQRSCDTTTAYMLFDEEARALRIKVEEAECTRIIIVRFSNIFFHTSGRDPDGWNAVFFSLELPPVFETEATRLELDLASIRPFFKGSPYDEHPRRRHSAFDDHHALTSAYTSCALRLVCRGKEDLDVFRGLSREAGLSDPHDYILPVIPQARFCSSVIAAFDEWLQDLDWTVAFQLEAATRAMIIDLKEALSLRSRIAILLAEKGARETASLLQYFRGEMRKLNTDGTNAAGQTETVEQCFLRCMRDFIPKRPSRRDRLSDDVFDCFHIYVSCNGYGQRLFIAYVH
jgi:RNA-dependent RNA polymerase